LEPLTQDIFMESTRMFPILKASGMAAGSASTCKDQTQEDEPQDDNHFDTGQVEFKFSEELDTKVVDEDNSDQDGYESSWVDSLSLSIPSTESPTGRCEVVWCDNDVQSSLSVHPPNSTLPLEKVVQGRESTHLEPVIPA
jgi:hypothetical protein